jgi:hypothetical protein
MQYSKNNWTVKSEVINPRVDIRKDKNYPKYMALKYEMLCKKINEFNINK